jgi:hypothetical protein
VELHLTHNNITDIGVLMLMESLAVSPWYPKVDFKLDEVRESLSYRVYSRNLCVGSWYDVDLPGCSVGMNKLQFL